MHNRELALLPQRLERRKRRMQPEEAVEIEHRFAWNIDARPHRVILRLGIRHHDVETVRRAPLKNDHQALIARPRLSRAPRGTREKAGYRRRAHNGERAVPKKNPTCDRHKNRSWLLAFGS